eukprot:346258-Alexandrium_andersonii.AAC.1
MRRDETCPEAQPLEVTQRATGVGAIEQARESSIDQLPQLLIRIDVAKSGVANARSPRSIERWVGCSNGAA